MACCDSSFSSGYYGHHLFTKELNAMQVYMKERERERERGIERLHNMHHHEFIDFYF